MCDMEESAQASRGQMLETLTETHTDRLPSHESSNKFSLVKDLLYTEKKRLMQLNAQPPQSKMEDLNLFLKIFIWRLFNWANEAPERKSYLFNLLGGKTHTTVDFAAKCNKSCNSFRPFLPTHKKLTVMRDMRVNRH